MYQENLRLNDLEFEHGHLYLYSRPRVLGIVLGDACNLRCIHCYQSHKGTALLRPAAMGAELRRELTGLYPFLSMLRIHGGEVFVLDGFAGLLDDAAAMTSRPIVSISTNGTLIDEAWAERIVRTPWLSLTVSIDAGTPRTFAALRRGGDLNQVIENIRRIQRWKQRLASELPAVDSFFVVMRSNYREIPQYLDLMRREGIDEVALQTLEVTGAVEHEAITGTREVRELHGILRESMASGGFRRISATGLRGLFEAHGLDAAFLTEGLHPDAAAMDTSLCPNPWTTLFVTENGDVHLCFLSTPTGNIYQSSLASIWNSPAAITKRADMSAGRFSKSGCSPQYCGWREGRSKPSPPMAALKEFQALRRKAAQWVDPPRADGGIGAVRETLEARERRIAELEALFARLCDTNAEFHERGRAYIEELERLLARQC